MFHFLGIELYFFMYGASTSYDPDHEFEKIIEVDIFFYLILFSDIIIQYFFKVLFFRVFIVLYFYMVI
jgi:hypothetical protein